jgi:hypothetical protein
MDAMGFRKKQLRPHEGNIPAFFGGGYEKLVIAQMDSKQTPPEYMSRVSPLHKLARLKFKESNHFHALTLF